MRGTSINGSLGNSSMERGDQSEHKGVTGKEGAVILFIQGRGCGVDGTQWWVFAVSFAPALRVTLCEAGVLWEPLHPTGEEHHPIVIPGQPWDVRGILSFSVLYNGHVNRQKGIYPLILRLLLLLNSINSEIFPTTLTPLCSIATFCKLYVSLLSHTWYKLFSLNCYELMAFLRLNLAQWNMIIVFTFHHQQHYYMWVTLKLLSRVWLFVIPWPVRGAWLLCPWNSLDRNTGVGSHSFSRGSSQGSNPGLSHCKQILYHLSHQGSSFYVGAPSKCCSEHFRENLCLWGCIVANLWI